DGFMDDSSTAPVFAALKTGRDLIDTWRKQPAAPMVLTQVLRAAGVDEWRTNLMVWAQGTGARDPFAMLRPSEIVRLGNSAEPPPMWSGTSRRLEGCYCR